jgi:sugar/nucleoside kinase (ribokinase family)
MKPFDVLVAGEINPDLILTGDVEPAFGQVEKLVKNATLTIGSSSAIFACGAARLGLKITFCGICGKDVFGNFMLDQLKHHGVDITNIRLVENGSTGLSVILNKGTDRAILTHLGLISGLKAEYISDDLLLQTRHLHVASYFIQQSLQAGLPHLFMRARTLGVTTSLDPNYDPSGQWRGFDELLAVTNVFLPNETEVCSLTGAKNAAAAADRLSGQVETLAIKLGAQGALGVRQNQKVRVPSIPVKVVDTVGAGDSFDAGFIYGYINAWPLEKSLRLAVVCGSLSTRKAGGTEGQATLQESLRILEAQ